VAHPGTNGVLSEGWLFTMSYSLCEWERSAEYSGGMVLWCLSEYSSTIKLIGTFSLSVYSHFDSDNTYLVLPLHLLRTHHEKQLRRSIGQDEWQQLVSSAVRPVDPQSVRVF
jgi:hypothetical protein